MIQDVDPAGIMSLTEYDLAVKQQLAEAEASRQRAIEASNADLEKRRQVERERDELRLALATAIKEGCSCDLLYGDRCFIHRLETVAGVAAVVSHYKALENILILTGDFIAKAGWAPADLADAIAALGQLDKTTEPGGPHDRPV